MPNYISFTKAQEIANERLNVDAWNDAVVEDGTDAGLTGSLTYKAIAMATAAIDRLNYIGSKSSTTQENQFPRGGDTEIPADIEKATFEIALALLDDVDPEMEASNLGAISQGYANVRSTYDREVPAPHIVAGIPSVTAWRYLVPYLRDPYTVDISRIS